MEYREEIEKAKEEIRKNRIEEGKAILEKLIGEGIEDKDIYLETGKCYIDNDNSKAIRNIERYVELGGEDINVKILLSKLYKLNGEIKKSREILEGIKEKNKEGLIELFRINVIEGEKEKALENVEEIDKRYKGEITEIEEIAEEFIKWKEYERTVKVLSNNRSNIEESKYHYYLYICYKGMEKKEKIIEEIEYLKEIKEYKKEIKEELIRESEREIEEIGYGIYKMIEMMSEYIEEDDTDSDIIRALAILLRKNMYDKEQKGKIIEILEKYRKVSKKPRAGNIFLNEKEILEKKTTLESKPRFLTVQLTTKCNLKCPMCVVYKNHFVIDDKVFVFIKETMPYYEKIVWQGGEVFLYDKFDELMELAAINGVKQSILTNGLLLNDKRIKLLSKYNIKIKISIDAVDKVNYEKIRLGGKFENLLSILERLKIEKSKNKNFGYMMAIVVNSLNYNKLEEMLTFAIKYGFECITFQNFIVNSVFEDKDLPLDFDKANYVLQYIKKIKKLSDDKKLPIKIETNFSLKDIDELMYSYKSIKSIKRKKESNKVSGVYHLSYINKTKDIVNSSHNLNYSCNQLMCLHSYGVNDKFSPLFNDGRLFCVSPWTKIYLDINNIMRSACNGYDIDISKSFSNLWNNEKLVEYRREIVNNNLKNCRVICRNNGEYSYMTLFGIV